MNFLKLVAMDFDSTLLDHTDGGKYIPRRTVEALTALINKGIPCGIDSGRESEALLDTFCRRISGRIPAIMALIETLSLPIDHWVVYSGLGMVVYFHTNEAAQAAMDLLKPYLADEPDVLLHRNTSILHIVPQNSGKGPSLLKAAQHKGLQPCQVLAIGDSLNDLSMLDGRHGFVSACVGNADDIVKDAVRQNNGYVAKGRAGEGVYEILQHFIAKGMLPG